MEKHQVADDQLAGRHLHAAPVASHGRPRRQDTVQGPRGVVCPPLLSEREQPVDDDDHRDRDRQLWQSGDHRQPRSDPEHGGEEVSHVPHQGGEW